jgi:hypothetical protein
MQKLLILLLISLSACTDPNDGPIENAIVELNVKANYGHSGYPYLNPIEENFMRSYLDEITELKRLIDKDITFTEKNKKLSIAFKSKNREVIYSIKKNVHTGISKSIANKIYKQLNENIITNDEKILLYDPMGDIGFCFGRAAMVHLLLLREGIKQQNIAKIFVLGKLMYKERLWDYHMATMVKGRNGKWWVIDNLFNEVKEVDNWLKLVTKFGIKKKNPQVRIYVTGPQKFQAAFPQYHIGFFQIPALKSYFVALFSN